MDKIVLPYMKKEAFFFEGAWVEFSYVDSFIVTQTDCTSNTAFKQSAERVRQGGYINMTGART
jgi:hypothetical protein